MAFISLPSALPRRGSPARFRMQETAASGPLNAAKAHEMKEVYAMQPGGKAPVCRCWQSAKFPLCDGSHNKFNKETGSHVGPLVVSVAKE